jgi:hypothetical protein
VENTVELRLLSDMPGGWIAGSGFQYKDSRRGDRFKATKEEGERLVAIGYATTDLECDVRDLPGRLRLRCGCDDGFCSRARRPVAAAVALAVLVDLSGRELVGDVAPGRGSRDRV